MWAWIYYGGMAVTVPIAEGCSWGEILAAADTAMSGLGTYGFSNCWLDGINHIVYMVYLPFTLQ